jgi:hypothetical protein
MLTGSKSFIGSSMTTIFVCDDQKAKYNQGICAKPNEQRRAQFSLWFAYAVDVATDLAGLYAMYDTSGLTDLGSDVLAVPIDLEPSTTKNAEDWYLRTLWQWLYMYCMCLNMFAIPMTLTW